MKNKSAGIRFTSNAPTGFNTNITLGGKTYHVQTEQGSTKSPVLSTRIYHDGEIVFSKKADCSDLAGEENFAEAITGRMKNHHQNVIDEFTRRHQETRRKTEYLDAVTQLLIRKNHKQALKILQDGLGELPDDPFILSYLAYLTAISEKNFAKSSTLCTKAVKKLPSYDSPDEKRLYTIFYLNLGRAFIACGNRKYALNAISEGLKIDKKNHDLLWELKKLGTRRKPAIPFLSRSNPINKYIGMILAKFKGK